MHTDANTRNTQGGSSLCVFLCVYVCLTHTECVRLHHNRFMMDVASLCVFTRAHTYACAYVCIKILKRWVADLGAYVCVRTCIGEYVYVCARDVYMCMCACVRVCACVFVCVRTACVRAEIQHRRRNTYSAHLNARTCVRAYVHVRTKISCDSKTMQLFVFLLRGS